MGVPTIFTCSFCYISIELDFCSNRDIWLAFLPSTGLTWFVPESIKVLISSWWCPGLSKDVRVIWPLLPAAISWSLWCERNNMVFDGCGFPSSILVHRSRSLIFLWHVSLDSDSTVTYNDNVCDWDLVVLKPP